MGSLGVSYNVDTMPEDDRNFDIIPSGKWLPMQAIESDVVDTNDRTGKILKLTLQVIDGGEPYVNRQLWIQLNIQNKSAQAQEISEKLLRGIMVGVGLRQLENHEELCFRPFLGRIKVDKSNDAAYPDKNVISAAKPIDGDAPAARPGNRPATRTAAAPQRTAPPATRPGAGARPTAGGGGTARPWGRTPAAAAPAQAQNDPDDDIPF